MTKKQKKEIIRKQKTIVVTGFLIILAIIVAIIVAITLNFKEKNEELAKSKGNMIYYSEAREEEGDNDVLVLGLNPENDKKTETNKGQKKNVDAPYYIKINNQANVVTIYKKDSEGMYSVPIKAMVCSIGDATPTSGVYTMSDKYTWRLLQGDVYGQYACRITGHILFHSVPYQKQDKSSLEWWEYDKLGTKASLGCIRLTVEDAKWIYDNCVSGTQVEFYYSADPGPLGKPTAEKISDDESVRNWDPTDPDERNPWRTYKQNTSIENDAIATHTEQ